jgi:hypothetical protein
MAATPDRLLAISFAVPERTFAGFPKRETIMPELYARLAAAVRASAMRRSPDDRSRETPRWFKPYCFCLVSSVHDAMRLADDEWR